MQRLSPSPPAPPRGLRTRLAAALLVALALAPALLAAGPSCAPWLCPPSADEHGCCPPPEASLLAPCCAGEDEPAATATSGTLRAPAASAAAVAASAAPAAPGLALTHAPEAAASPPGDLLARHCILRI